jgi:hypothetical protein
MAKRVLYYLKRVASSRLGHILLILHLSLVVFDFAQKTPVSRAENNRVVEAGETMESATLVAGRMFHYHYESPLLKFLIFVDLPGIFLSLLLGLVLLPISYIVPLGEYDESWMAAGIYLLSTSIQWQFIGYCLERVFKSSNRSERGIY